MPKGKDFLDEFVAMMVVDADAEVGESLEALPAGLLRSRRKKRRIAPNVHSDVPACWRCLDTRVQMAFGHGIEKTGAILSRQLESGTLQPCVVRCRFSPILFALKSGG